jgi:DNA invertase Pin-like site-specific DNA recombinase
LNYYIHYPELLACLRYLREGDTLVVTRLDRLARSVFHLTEITNRFAKENIDLLVIDQAIDTSSSTGRLMFNMLATIAEFENDLRSERQREGIINAQEKGIRFGRPQKLTDELKLNIRSQREAGATIKELAQRYKVGQATIYRVL